MNFVIIILLVFISIKTASYGIFEKKENNNTLGAIGVFLLCACTLAAIYRFI